MNQVYMKFMHMRVDLHLAIAKRLGALSQWLFAVGGPWSWSTKLWAWSDARHKEAQQLLDMVDQRLGRAP